MTIYTFVHDVSSLKNEDNKVYAVMAMAYSDSPKMGEDSSFISTLLRRSIDGGVQNVNGKIISEKNIMLGSYPGRDVKIAYGDGAAIIRMHAYVVKNMLYMIQVFAEPAKDNNKSMTRFLGSFKVG